MLEIYYGNAKGKTRLCVGAAIRAAMKDRAVLFVRFFSDGEAAEKKAFDLFSHITELCPPIGFDLFEEDASKIAQASKIVREYFDRAVITALTFKYDELILDDIFDMTETGLLPESAVYDFLSNAPDSLEVIATGRNADEKFLKLAALSVRMMLSDDEPLS